MIIERPTLLLDEEKCLRNIRNIVDKAARSDVRLRPHFKTHLSHEIGRWFRKEGITSCTVSSLQMAEYFAADGWNDITVAFPVNYLEAERINRLASLVTLNILACVPGVLPRLMESLRYPVRIFIEIDTGYHRTGVSPDDHETIRLLLQEIKCSALFQFAGFLSHAGGTYQCRNRIDVEAVHHLEMQSMMALRTHYRKDFPNLILSIGDTPSISIVNTFEGVDEIRPGNLVFYDLTQHAIGSCQLDQIALTMACPVVAAYPSRNEIIIYGGGVHFAKDFLKTADGTIHYGLVVKRYEGAREWPLASMYVKSLSQEHGIVAAPHGVGNIRPGDCLGILPVHACLTADAMGEYRALNGAYIERMAKSFSQSFRKSISTSNG